MSPLKLFLPFAVGLSCFAAAPTLALHPDDLPAITVSPGVILKELTGRTSPKGAQSERCSVAFFHLEPGRGSAWSYNKLGEESFFVLKGRGAVWTGGRRQAVRAGSYILIPASEVRSIRADQGEILEFYAVTAPSWSPDDDVLTVAPAGAPR